MNDDPKKSDLGSGCPMNRPPGPNEPKVYGRSDLTYNEYLKVPELLSLQVPQSAPAHHDELLFIVIHQAYELWFKLILHEIGSVMEHMGNAETLRARHHAARCVEILRLLVSQIHILETMTPADFLAFREHLNPASGFQSLQFREIEFVAGLKDERYLSFFAHKPDVHSRLKARLAEPDLRGRYLEMLKRLGFDVPIQCTNDDEKKRIIAALLPVYRNPKDHLPLYLLSESLVDFDAQLGLWREHHVRVVERIIGFKRGTGGSSGVEYLQSTTGKKCFPYLWELRTELA